MTCTPSQQTLRIEAQLISPDDNDPYLGSPLRMALHPLYSDLYAMHRHEPEKEADARTSLLARLAIALDGDSAVDVDATTAAGLPSPVAPNTADDFLAAHEQALAEKRIAAFRPFGEFLLTQMNDGSVLVQRTNLILEAPLEPLVLCLDHTQYWTECEQVTEAGRIFTTYLTDTSVGYHACELEPSYDLRHLYSTPENDNDERSISEWVSEHDDPSDSSLHARYVKRLADSKKAYQERTYMEAGDDYEKTMERLLDNLRGNPVLQVPESRRERQPAPGL